MKILIDTRYIRENPCGIGNYTLNLTQALSSLGKADLNINALSYKDNQTKFFKGFSVIPKETETNFTSHPANEIFLNTTIPNILKKENFNIFHGPAVFIPFRKNTNYKLVTTIHDIVSIRFPETVPFKYRFYLKQMTKSAVKNADAIACASFSTKEDLIKYFKADESKITVTHYAADEFYFTPSSENENNNVLQKLNLTDTPYILSVGNIEPRKNLLNLIKAFTIVKETKKYKDLKLVLTGRKGWLYKEILQEAEKIKEDIIFTGYVTKPELKSLYSKSLFFVFASLYEGFGLPLLEAMATKTATLVSNTSSLPEIAKDCAIYTNPYDFKDIADKILFLIEDKNKREELKEKGFTNSRNFSWKKTAEQTLKIYQNIK